MHGLIPRHCRFWAGHILLILFASMSLSASAVVPDHTWTGASSALWSDPNNWSPASVPTNGETLLFPPVAVTHLMSTNDLPGLVLNSVLFTGSGYTLDGAGIVLSGDITSTGGAEKIALPIDVQANAVTLTNTGGMTLAGALSGSGPISTQGSLTLSGSLDNYHGTITVSGYVYLETSSAAALPFINNGVVIAQGASLPNASIQDGGNGYVAGTGTLGVVTTKRLSVGYYGGVLHTGDLAIHGGYATFSNLGSATASRLDVTGTVNIDPATTLNTSWDPAFVPVVGQELMLIDNDGNDPINGTLANLPDGAIITSNFVPYELSYHGGSGNDLTLTAYPGQVSTTTTIASISPLAPVSGQAVEISYSVNGGQSPTGVVSVLATTGETCSGAVSAGKCVIVFASAGARTLTATYQGDNNNPASTSQPAVLTVTQAATSLSLVSALPNPSVINESVTVTASINVQAPGSGSPTGTIDVSAPDSAGCTIVLPAATCSLTFTAAGSKSLSALYSGDADFAISTATPLAQTVNDPATIDLAIEIDDAVPFAEGGQSLTYLITVRNNGSADAHNATVQDLLPGNLSNAVWTCAPVGAASCSASGTGSIADVVDLPSSTAVVYQLTAEVAAIPEQAIVETATVAVAAGEVDSNPANNTMTDTDIVGIFRDSFESP